MASTVRFGKIDSVILFGGTVLLSNLARQLQKEKIKVTVFAAPRHLEESVDQQGHTLAAVLKHQRIPFYSSDDINADPRLAACLNKTTLGVLLGAAWDLDKKTIARFKGRLVEIMPIPVPAYRGGAHQTHQILRGQTHWKSSIQWVVPEKHRGPLLLEKTYATPAGRPPQAYLDQVASECEQLFLQFIHQVRAGASFMPQPLDESKAMHFPFLYTRAHGWINWDWTAAQIALFCTAFDMPYAGASSTLRGRRVFFQSVRLYGTDGPFHPFQAGLVYRKSDGKLFVAANGGALVVESLKDESGADAYGSVQLGDRFLTPRIALDEALAFSAEYDAKGLKAQKGKAKRGA